MNLPVNEGDRPSLLALGRLASGELGDDEAAALRDQLGDAERDTLAAIDAARAVVRPFDAAALRARARASSATDAPAVPAPANNAGRAWFLGLATMVALAAAVLFALVGTGPNEGGEAPSVTFRSGDALQVYVLEGRQLAAWDGRPLLGDDVVGFKVHATGHRSVVLLSVDHTGQVEVYWPEDGRGSEPLEGRGMVALDGTLVLDDLQGSEAFVAVFDTAADTAVSQAERAFADGGLEGVRGWSDATAGVAAVAVPRGAEVR